MRRASGSGSGIGMQAVQRGNWVLKRVRSILTGRIRAPSHFAKGEEVRVIGTLIKG